MFWPDVIELKSFYASALGQVACQAIRRKIKAIWPEANGETMLGVGYATPYLLPYLDKCDLTIACMPAAQGVVHWPTGGRANLALLADEGELPFATGTVNRLLIIHALENSEQARRLLAEAYRLLTPSGRLLIIVPNRNGIWARSPDSPFVLGHPYTTGQLKRLLRESKFTPLQAEYALFVPPTHRRFILRSARIWESLGRLLFSRFSGVLMIEAEKQIYAPTKGKVQPIYNTSRAYSTAPVGSS